MKLTRVLTAEERPGYTEGEIWEFETVTDLIDQWQNPLDAAGEDWTAQGDRRASMNKDYSSFAGATWQEALKMSREGWPEGLKQVEKFRTKLEDSLRGLIPILETYFDVTGDFLDIGRYVTGEPEVFGELVDTGLRIEASQPRIIRLVANIATSAAIGHDTIMTRGAAICALVDMLERHGYRVQIDLVDAIGRGGVYFEQRTRCKESGEVLQLDKLVFLLAHPASQRRIAFGVQEHVKQAWRRSLGISDSGSGYGQVVEAWDKGDIYMAQISSYRDWSEDVAIAWIKSQLKRQGIYAETEGE